MSGSSCEEPVDEASAPAETADGASDVEKGFFQRGDEEDRMSRDELRKQLAAMPRWPGLRWAMVAITLALVAAVLLVAV